ncbi:GNAT family N-acetyltransferase [Sphingomonas sp. AAP5]|uniref:GNAT family N-acetyltransferase n=1 Tax=Sphingomonas sp. AAP5 TaxID=1523415 RepID=UPI0010570224|nr:GNAT family N-acetyltransferase [Sphingomonas sp. AAP5]QBM75370.1 GNAT family N-acetyltransferase [Sphingomonas sp. AAP5]
MPKWRVRRAGPADADLLSLVANAAFLDTYAPSLAGADLVAHCLKNNSAAVFAKWLADPATVVTVAEIEPGFAPIGYAVLTAPDFPIALQPGDIELRRIYTLRQAYGSGTGAALMAQAIADAVLVGAKRVLLGVWDQNARARAFYERNGFSVIGSRDFVVGGEVHVDPVYARGL